MTPCFADTFFFLALLNASDSHHQRAVQANRENRLVATTTWILLELADHLKNRHLPSRVQTALAADLRFEVVPAAQALLDRAVQLYDQRNDKEWSLTDCTAFVRMKERGIAEAWTADHHFEQAGFKALFQ